MSFKDTLKGLASEVLADANDLLDSAYQAIPSLTESVAAEAGEILGDLEEKIQQGLVKGQSYVLDLQDKLDNM